MIWILYRGTENIFTNTYIPSAKSNYWNLLSVQENHFGNSSYFLLAPIAGNYFKDFLHTTFFQYITT